MHRDHVFHNLIKSILAQHNRFLNLAGTSKLELLFVPIISSLLVCYLYTITFISQKFTAQDGSGHPPKSSQDKNPNNSSMKNKPKQNTSDKRGGKL